MSGSCSGADFDHQFLVRRPGLDGADVFANDVAEIKPVKPCRGIVFGLACSCRGFVGRLGRLSRLGEFGGLQRRDIVRGGRLLVGAYVGGLCIRNFGAAALGWLRGGIGVRRLGLGALRIGGLRPTSETTRS